jgi:hypothetical protein
VDALVGYAVLSSGAEDLAGLESPTTIVDFLQNVKEVGRFSMQQS